MTFAPNLLLHDTSRRLVEAYLTNPSHAVLLHGKPGVGLTTVATEIAKYISPRQPHIEVAPIDGKDISIDQIRPLYSATQTVETTGKVVIIDDAHTMSLPAQNAFLKLLEEPPAHVHFIMVVHDLNALLPTIHSRTEVIDIRPVSQSQTREFVSTLTTDPTTKAQLEFLAGGLPALAKRLSEQPEGLAASADLTRDARMFLQGTYYDRLMISNKYAANRDAAISFVTTIGQLVIHMVRKQTEQSAKLSHVAATIDRLHENANTKLQMIRLSLAL